MHTLGGRYLELSQGFIRLHLLDVTNADTIVTVTKNAIHGINLNLKICREQRYDGCSTMRGEKTIVAKQIKVTPSQIC